MKVRRRVLIFFQIISNIYLKKKIKHTVYYNMGFGAEK